MLCQIPFADLNPPTDNIRNKLPEMKTREQQPLSSGSRSEQSKQDALLLSLLPLLFSSLRLLGSALEHVCTHTVCAGPLTRLLGGSQKTHHWGCLFLFYYLEAQGTLTADMQDETGVNICRETV